MASYYVSVFLLAYNLIIDIMCYNSCVTLKLKIANTHTKLAPQVLSCSSIQSKTLGIFKIITIFVVLLPLRESIQNLHVAR